MNIVYWGEPKDTTITKIRVTRSIRPDGTFEEVTVITPAYSGTPPAHVWTTQYIDSAGQDQHWYIMEFLDASDNIKAKSDPRPGETTVASCYEILWRLRVKIGDMQTPYCYKDVELLQHLNEALLTVGKHLTWDTLEEIHEVMIIWVCMHQICLELATDSAKFYNLTIEGVTVNKADRVMHYTSLAEKYWNKFITKRDEWAEGDKEGPGTIIIGNLTRESGLTGRRVPYIQALPPETPRLWIGNVTALTVELNWNQNTDPGFYYYVLFRSEFKNEQQRAIEDIYHKRIAALYNDITDYTPLWGNITTPIKMIYRSSVNYWQDMNRPGLIRPYYPTASPMLWPGRTYYYCMGVVDKNILISLSQEIAVTTTAFLPPTILAPVYAKDGVVKGTGEPTATVELWIDDGGGYVKHSDFEIPPGYGVWSFDVVLTAGWKVKVKQTLDTLDSGFGTEETVV